MPVNRKSSKAFNFHTPNREAACYGTLSGVMVQLLQHADALGSAGPWHDHCRAAKKRSRAIEYTRGRPKRVKHYRELLRITRTTLGYLQQAAVQLTGLASSMRLACVIFVFKMPPWW
ncbi:putative transposase [Mesorhizobium amorphae CCNWGS0123]|uniref:Putative transposase n=1 Tax=Mesorhizobium amorphae CCNWGS0123 TaxID=1082933 RepID=G6Y3R6_9HYPH|nr:putative transposase [Mesorhizobium amorphae CCNWGS0123]